MINSIIDGISVALDEEFGDDYEIYTEDIEQDLDEGCFSVICINPRSQQFLGNRYFKQNQFCVHYFPKTDEKNHDCLAVIDRLYDCLEVITVGGDLVRGLDMNAEISDGVVSFFVNYDLFAYKQVQDEESMESYGVNTNVKG